VRTSRIGRKVTRGVLFLTLTILFFATISFSFLTNRIINTSGEKIQQTHYDRIQTKAQYLSQTISSLSKISFATLDFSTLSEVVTNKVKADPEVLSVVVYDNNTHSAVVSSDSTQLFQEVEIDKTIEPADYGKIHRKTTQTNVDVFRFVNYIDHDQSNYILRIEFTTRHLDTEIAESKNHQITQLRNFFTILFSIFATLFIFAVFYGRKFGQRISAPISVLNESAKAISAGDLKHPITVESRDEIGDLAESFEQMRIDISKKIDEINAWNTSLEEKVSERTQELEQAQSALLQNSKLAALGVMSSGIAHEINNPLAIVSGLLQVLSIKVIDPSSLQPEEKEKAKDLVNKIQKASNRIADIVHRVRMFSRQTTSQDKTIFPTNEIVDDVIFFVNPLLKKNSINLNIEYGNDLPELYGVKGDLVSVLQNIAQNAIDEMKVIPEEESERVLTVKSYKSEKGITISVTDTANGVPLHIRDKIFDPFFTTKKVGSGTGLGLSLCYSIVNEYDGTIELETEDSKGSTFYIKLGKAALAESYKGAA
jgi:signal transduction histidine kinase